MGPSASYAASFPLSQLATSIKTAASSSTAAALKSQSEAGKKQEEEEEEETKSTSRSSNNLGFAAAYRQQQQQLSSYQQYCCPYCGRQQPCECSDSKPTGKSSNCLEFDQMDRQHYSRQTLCSPLIGDTKNAQGDGSFRGSNNDSNNNIDGRQTLSDLYDQQGHDNQFNYQIHQHPSSQSGQELEISRRGGGSLLSESRRQHLSYDTDYPETGESWTLPPLSVNNQLVSRASQFSEPTFSGGSSSSSQTTNSGSEQHQVSYGYGLYSNYNNKIGSFEDLNDLNNNNQQLHQQNSVFPSGHHFAPVISSPVGRDPSYQHYQQAHSTSISQEQVYTTNSNFYSIASNCNQTSDYSARHQPQNFQQQDRSCHAQGHQPMQTVSSLGAHNDQQSLHNSRPIQSPNTLADRSAQSIQQRQDCSNYGPIATQQQQSNSHQIPLLQEHTNNPSSSNRTQIYNNQCYEGQHVQPHQLYQCEQQHIVRIHNQVANNERYSEQGYTNLQQPTTNCDVDRISATTTSPLATDGGSELIRTPTINKPRSLKGRRGRPRKKSVRSKNKVNGKLWEFIRDLLLNERTNPSFIRWERREDGVFKFVQSDKVAKMWGERKQNPKMTYEKLSRAMRYYYKSKVLLPVLGRRLVYKFGPNATGWMPETKGDLY